MQRLFVYSHQIHAIVFIKLSPFSGCNFDPQKKRDNMLACVPTVVPVGQPRDRTQKRSRTRLSHHLNIWVKRHLRLNRSIHSTDHCCDKWAHMAFSTSLQASKLSSSRVESPRWSIHTSCSSNEDGDRSVRNDTYVFTNDLTSQFRSDRRPTKSHLVMACISFPFFWADCESDGTVHNSSVDVGSWT